MKKVIFVANLAAKQAFYNILNLFKVNFKFAQINYLKLAFVFTYFLLSCEKQEVDINSVENINWQLTKIKTMASEQLMPNSVNINLKMAKGDISGNGSCNDYNVNYKIEENRKIKVGTIGSTKKYCENSSNWENKYFSFLEKSETYKVQNNSTLEIYCGDLGTLVFIKGK